MSNNPASLPNWLGNEQPAAEGKNQVRVDEDTKIEPINVEGIDSQMHLTEPFILLNLSYAKVEKAGQEPQVIISDVGLEASVLGGERGLPAMIEQAEAAIELLKHHLEHNGDDGQVGQVS